MNTVFITLKIDHENNNDSKESVSIRTVNVVARHIDMIEFEHGRLWMRGGLRIPYSEELNPMFFKEIKCRDDFLMLNEYGDCGVRAVRYDRILSFKCDTNTNITTVIASKYTEDCWDQMQCSLTADELIKKYNKATRRKLCDHELCE